MQQFPQPLLHALRDPHEDGRVGPALTQFLEAHPEAADDLPAVATAVTKVVGKDDRQLSKVMLELWRNPDPNHKRIAALCAPALTRLDMKRALRFLQKAEKKVAERESCDLLAAAFAAHAAGEPQFWIREAQNRLSSNRPLVRRLGLGLLRDLATTGAPHAEEARTLLRSLDGETDALVAPLRDELLAALADE